MKKILAVLTALTVFTPTVVTVMVACGSSHAAPPAPPKPPTPPTPPEKHDIAYYEDLIVKSQAEVDSTNAYISKLGTKESSEQICGNDGGCPELMKMIDVENVKVYKNNVIIDDSGYQILVLQNPDGFDEKVKAEAKPMLRDEIFQLEDQLYIMNLWVDTYSQKDIDEVNAQMKTVQEELNKLN